MSQSDSLNGGMPVAGEPPILDPLFRLLEQAVRESATDVHIDTWGNEAALRFRVDGAVHHREPLSYEDARRLVNQVKVAAGLDMAAPFTPLEGHFRWSSGGVCRDVRATVLMTAPRHEAAHLRLLMLPEQWRDIHNLGLNETDQSRIESALRCAHGLVLIAGPTGAGKTTTLYSLTRLTDLRSQIAASIEDPAEFDLPYVRQLEVKEKHGFTMEEGLKAVLRLDPDIVLVGEIRDAASASIAARAALSGRLVMATIHARDAAMAVEAMHYLSVPYYVLGSALRLVIAQDLVRKLCPVCARKRPVAADERALFENAQLTPPESIYDAVGCAECFGHGYRGRVGVFQVAVIDDECGHWLATGPSRQVLRDRLRQNGARLLAADALEKAARGITSMQEVLKFYGHPVDRPLVVLPSKEAQEPCSPAPGASA